MTFLHPNVVTDYFQKKQFGRMLIVGAVVLIVLVVIHSNYEHNQTKYNVSLKSLSERLENNPATSIPKIQILMWTPMQMFTLLAEKGKDIVLDDCGKYSCRITNRNSSTLNTSDAVMFNLRNEDFVIDGKVNVPDYHPPGQYWILYNHEGMFLEDKFYDAFPGDVFNLTATYRRDADIYLPYGKCEPRKHGKYELPSDFLKKKTGLAVWHVTHCTDRSLRLTFTKQLQKHIKVDIFGAGRCSKKTLPQDYRLHVGHNLTDVATANINEYKFYLSFENTYCKDYITEKSYKMFQDNVYTVPVVRGSGPYDGMLPPGSYINADDFKDAKELADYLTKLDQNDQLYMKYFKSRTDYECSTDSYNITHRFCELCDGVSRAVTQQLKKTYNQNKIYSVIHPRENCVLYNKNKKMRPKN